MKPFKYFEVSVQVIIAFQVELLVSRSKLLVRKSLGYILYIIYIFYIINRFLFTCLFLPLVT